MQRRALTTGLAAAGGWCLAGCSTGFTAPGTTARNYSFAAGWQQLPTEAFKGKQDDIHFVDINTGWYVNGEGKIYGTSDGGASWQRLLQQSGTYFRAVGFVDRQLGFAGNIGTDYYPGVTDTVALYRSGDAGKTWVPVAMGRAVNKIRVLHTDTGFVAYAIGVQVHKLVGQFV
jgi:photosystem II stability/assembly factor-like uncharacterized protein